MTSNSHTHSRELQQDARAWAEFTGTKYTAALRQMSSPFAQGLLGERVSARRLIAALDDHVLIGAGGGDSILGENGFDSEASWSFDRATDYIQLSLITDMLRMFTPIAETSTPEVSSYSAKHTAERFLDPHCSYVSNGRLIWAAAALGLQLAKSEGGGPNLLIGLSEREHDYVRRTVDQGQADPRGHHFRPAGYAHLQGALQRLASGEPLESRWVRPIVMKEPTPFHDWLTLQAGRDDAIGDLASDYSDSVRGSLHRIARTAEELLVILNEVGSSRAADEAAEDAIAEWKGTQQSSTPFRTELIYADSRNVEGFGAGPGTMERYEYLCPCGDGKIIEEHDNVPGFRDHSMWIECDMCRAEWRSVGGNTVREWSLERIPAGGAD